MFQTATTLAETRAVGFRKGALEAMSHRTGREMQRLQTLQQTNDHIRPEEIRLAQSQQPELVIVLKQSRIRLDSVRRLWKRPLEILN